MSVHISTVPTKGQTIVPEAVRKALGLIAGKRIVWELRSYEGTNEPHLVVRPSRLLSALAGSLSSSVPFPGIEEEKEKVAELRDAQLARKHRPGK